MGVKSFRPKTPSRRYMTVSDFSEITRSEPEKSLLRPGKSSGGRNSHGHVTARHRGGGHKRRLRVVDFRREKHGIPGRVKAIEYDPSRSARLALLAYADGEKRYILAPHGVRLGDRLVSGKGSDVRVGNMLPLDEIPLGSMIHNVEMVPGKGGQLARSAGSYVQLAAREGKMALLKLPSGELRYVPAAGMAVIGQVGNMDHENVKIGKAGRSRWLGRRPQTRGVAMNPVDHPMGGGEGKSSGGRHPVSPTGVPAKGFKTRKRKPSDRMIVRRRKKK
jgi:large subunit ribosomal protein L2